MRVIVTGGCGYVGSILVPKLLAAGHVVRVVDLQWFGNHLEPHKNLNVIKADFRDSERAKIGEAGAIIHLAAVANDATGELDPKITWEANALGTMQLAQRCVRLGVKQFIYASSGSVYGVSEEPQVTEDASLVPLSEYNKTKAVAERVLLSYADSMCVQILRPATVCGFSPRMRLDVMVNSFTIQALTQGYIVFNGGDQFRPNIHIEDMADLYLWMLARPSLNGVYNAGFENLAIKDIAAKVAERVPCKIHARPTNDKRSYRINSDKLLATGFKPRRTVDDAIGDIIASSTVKELADETRHYNLKTMPRAA